MSSNIPERLDTEIEDAFGFPAGVLAHGRNVVFASSSPHVSRDQLSQMLIELMRASQRQELQRNNQRRFGTIISESRQEFSDMLQEKEALLFAYQVTETFETSEVSNPDCCICTEPMLQDSLTYFKYECGHALHTACARQWMYTNPGRATCPICRKEYAL